MEPTTLTTPLIPLVIDRQRWLRGEGAYESYLLRNRDGRMCCLGFACKTLGAREDQMADETTPANITHSSPTADVIYNRFYRSADARHTTDTAMNINDAPEGTKARILGSNSVVVVRDAAHREDLLKPLLRDLGFDAEFIN